MRKVDWSKPIIGGDGVSRDRGKIECLFKGWVEKEIKKNLEDLKNTLPNDYPQQFRDYIDCILRNLSKILVSKPQDLEILKHQEDRRRVVWNSSADINKKVMDDFYKDLLKAFNYSRFRKKELNWLAIVLNVKSCLYCNQQYTIAFGNVPGKEGEISTDDSESFLQFDHFFGETEYPIMSMSLYNLIPSCAICNQRKSKTHINLKLHPYESDLSSLIRFRIRNPDAFINPKIKNSDSLEMEIDTFGDKTIEDFIKRIKLKKRYDLHMDIVQELEVAMYMASYYNGHFEDINKIFAKEGGCCSPEIQKTLHRHFKGFYADPDDINKRPLIKFSQDIYTQLCSWYEGL